MKKLLALLLAILTVFSATACTIVEDDGGNDDALYTLNVGFYQGGLGSKYMDEIIKLYEKANPDVNVQLRPGKLEFADGSLIPQISDAQASMDLYVLDSNNYQTFYQGGYLEDITDITTKKVYDNDGNLVGNGGTQSIEDMMWDDYVTAYKTPEGKFYALPNYVSFPGIIYDADLFEDFGYEVPETYPEFYALMESMVLDGITPFAFSNDDYIILAGLESFVAMYEGRSDYLIRSTYNGTHSRVGEITLENAYKLQEAEGKKAGLQLAHDLANNPTFVTQSTRNGRTNTEAQEDFVTSMVLKSKPDNPRPRIAMFIEHSYWEREAYGTFKQMGDVNPLHGYGKRNFKYMKAPKMIGVEGIADTTNTKDTVFMGGVSGCWMGISAKAKQKELAKDFVQFMHSRECLAQFIMHASVVRPFDFKLTDAEKAVCTPYGLSIYDVVQDQNVELVAYGALNDLARTQGSDFSYDFRFYSKFETTELNGQAGVTDASRKAFTKFMQYPQLTVQQYFDGYKAFWTETNWKERLDKIK